MANVPGLGEVNTYTLTISLKFVYRHDMLCVTAYSLVFCTSRVYKRMCSLVCVGSELGPVPWPPTEHSCYEASPMFDFPMQIG